MKYIFTILSFVFFSFASKAQMSITYSMGVLGGDMKLSTSSNPLSVNLAACLQVSNGVSKFLVANNGEFVNDCVVNLNYTKLSIQVAPNPFVDAVYITFKSKLDEDNHFKVSVFNNYGQLVKITSIYQNLFLSGFKLPLAELPTGIYFLQINSSKVNEVFKIIKDN